MVYLVTNVLIGRFVLPGRFRPAPHAVNHKPGISDCPTSGRTRPSQGSNGHAHGHVTRLRAYAHAPNEMPGLLLRRLRVPVCPTYDSDLDHF